MNKYTDFVQKLKLLLRVTFKEVADNKDLFEFGIFTDQDVTTIVIYYNTYTHFANQLKDKFLKYKRIPCHYRWSMPEWYGQLGDYHPLMIELNEEFYQIAAEERATAADPCFVDDSNRLGLLYQALVELREEGLFNPMDENFILYIEKADSRIDEVMRNRIKELIGEKYYQDFLYDQKDYFV